MTRPARATVGGGLRIGIAKPDYGIEGGFELNLRRIQRELEARGHTIEWLTVDVGQLARRPFGVQVPEEVWDAGREYFNFVNVLDAFRVLDASRVDVVLTTQPGSYAVEHPRKLALFYHHHRVFYDLSEVYLEARFADPAQHVMQQHALREIDQEHLDSVTHFLAGSATIRDRLAQFNGIRDNVSLFQAALPQHLTDDEPDPATAPFEHALCVSRHEFPKRTELFVHAMTMLPGVDGVAVGGGGRLPWVKHIDRSLASSPWQGEVRELWLSRHEHTAELEAEGDAGTNVRYVSGIPGEELAELYRRALCVVAPAYDEDYGHTAMEAMAFGKPVIVCKDGGGLTELVEDGVHGFVVDPDGEAIAAAVEKLRADPDLAREMGRNGIEQMRRFTWDHAMEQFTVGLDRVTA